VRDRNMSRDLGTGFDLVEPTADELGPQSLFCRCWRWDFRGRAVNVSDDVGLPWLIQHEMLLG